MVFGMVYYGVALAAGDIGGELYRDYILQSLLEFPSIGLGIYICNRYAGLQINFIFLDTQSHYFFSCSCDVCTRFVTKFFRVPAIMQL